MNTQAYHTLPQTLILIRGIPGSGKTTLARSIASSRPGALYFENDMYFLDDRGHYYYRPEQIKDAVAWCLRRTEQGLHSGYTVIVSNTFTQRWEMTEYFKMAEKFNVPIQIIETWAPWESVHNVPPEKMKAMHDRFTPTKNILVAEKTS